MSQAVVDFTKLTVRERIELIGDIWDSIVAEGEPIGLTEAQRQELDRRIKAAEDGTMKWIPWEEVRRQAR